MDQIDRLIFWSASAGLIAGVLLSWLAFSIWRARQPRFPQTLEELRAEGDAAMERLRQRVLKFDFTPPPHEVDAAVTHKGTVI